MPSPRDPATLLAAARLYYVQGASQAEVAAQLGTSRSNVSRMLTEAQRQGIVEIRINDPIGRVHELEERLTELFGLRDARVAHVAGPGARPEEQVGRQAARLLLDELKDSMTVALSWGTSLQGMVYAVTAETEHHDVTLVQLVGGLSSIANEISGQELVRELALRIGADYRFLHAPATVTSPASARTLLAEPAIAAALEQATRADLAFVGIGSPEHGSSNAIVRSLDLDGAEHASFRAARPVGDLAARYYDAQGHPVDAGVGARVVAVTLDDLVAIPHVVGVAHGRAKTHGVLGALRGRLVDSLVCDESLARSVLSEAGRTGSDAWAAEQSPTSRTRS